MYANPTTIVEARLAPAEANDAVRLVARAVRLHGLAMRMYQRPERHHNRARALRKLAYHLDTELYEAHDRYHSNQHGVLDMGENCHDITSVPEERLLCEILNYGQNLCDYVVTLAGG